MKIAVGALLEIHHLGTSAQLLLTQKMIRENNGKVLERKFLSQEVFPKS